MDDKYYLDLGYARLKTPKGQPGYIAYEKKKRTILTLIMFAIPLIIFFTGLIQTGTRKNLFTLVAILGILPAAKVGVNWIMILLQRNADPEMVKKTQERAGTLTQAYELTVTAYEGRMPLDCLVICGNTVACYSANGDRSKFGFMEQHMAKILSGNDYYGVKVKIFNQERPFLERVESLAKDPDKYREGIRFTPDERYPDLSREELIKQVLMAISI